jgi:DNA-binding transcriptional ArsR family regulator
LDITNEELEVYFYIAQGLKIDAKFVKMIVADMKECGADVLMLDSLRSMHEAEENDSTEMQAVLDHLKEIARSGITVIFTHHHRKKHPLEKQQGADASRGSSAINAAISGHISLDEEKREDGTFLIVHHLKSKAGAKIEPVEVRITVGDLTGTVTFEYQGTFKAANKKIETSKEAIIKALKDGEWMSISDFLELGIASHSVLRAALRELKKAGVAKTMFRGDAKSKGITVNGEGRANELIYAWCEGKENELDTFVEDANITPQTTE